MHEHTYVGACDKVAEGLVVDHATLHGVTNGDILHFAIANLGDGQRRFGNETCRQSINWPTSHACIKTKKQTKTKTKTTNQPTNQPNKQINNGALEKIFPYERMMLQLGLGLGLGER